MGGMVAQHMAIKYPERVLSLTSIMSTVGGRFAGAPRLSIIPLFLAKPTSGKEAFMERAQKLFKAIGSPRYFDGEAIRELAEQSWERGINMAGTGRQMAAITADGNRTKRLRGVTAPTLVMHGEADKLVTPSGGRATAKAIAGAKLKTFEGMGHDLPRALWPEFIDAIVENTQRASDKEVVASAT